MAGKRFLVFLLTTMGSVALFLATIGTYGLMAYSVSERTREIGLRMALGAKTKDVTRHILGEGATLVVVGVVIGLVGAFFVSRLLAHFVFQIQTTDLVSFGSAALVLAVAAIGGSYVAVRRVSNVEPMVALRTD